MARSSLRLAAVAVVFATTPLVAQTQVTDRAEIVEASTVDWAQLGEDFTLVPTPFNFSTDLGEATGTHAGFASVFTVGVTWMGGFTPGETVLFDDVGMLTFSFASNIAAFATQAWFSVGSGDVRIEAFRGASSIGFFEVFTLGGIAENNGQASVVGISDLGGFDQVRLSAASPFGINQLTLGELASATVVPEPASLALLATGLAGMAALGRRRRTRQG